MMTKRSDVLDAIQGTADILLAAARAAEHLPQDIEPDGIDYWVQSVQQIAETFAEIERSLYAIGPDEPPRTAATKSLPSVSDAEEVSDIPF